MNSMPDIDNVSLRSNRHLRLQAITPICPRTAMRGIGDTPEAAMAQLVRMLDPVNSAGAIMERMPVVSASTCQLLREATEVL
jgi:hypothetical protein